MGVITEKDGPVTTVILSRPDVRKAVDRPKAEAMANEFRHGLKSLASGSVDGAKRFSKGAGRHGLSIKIE